MILLKTKKLAVFSEFSAQLYIIVEPKAFTRCLESNISSLLNYFCKIFGEKHVLFYINI